MGFVFLAGCGHSDGDVLVDAAAGDAWDCNDVSNTAPGVISERVAASRPRGTGGGLRQGVYERVAHVLYTGVGGNEGLYGGPLRETLRVSATQIDQVFSDGLDEWRTTAPYQLIGPDITLTHSCGGQGEVPITQYSVPADDALLLFGDIGSTGFVTTYQRQ